MKIVKYPRAKYTFHVKTLSIRFFEICSRANSCFKSPQKTPFVIFCCVNVVNPLKSEKKVRHLSDNSVEALLEPLDGVVTGDAVRGADAALGAATTDNTLARAGHAAVEVHTVDTNTGVVLDAEIDVLGDTEAEVAGLAEVALAQLVLLDLEATLENLLSLGATDSDVDSDLFVTADTEGTDGVAGLACGRGRGLGLHSPEQALTMHPLGRRLGS